jgi:hypothetical protein
LELARLALPAARLARDWAPKLVDPFFLFLPRGINFALQN